MKVKAVYTGELSKIFQSDLGIEIARGEPFDVDEKWLEARMKHEPERWKKHTAQAAKGTGE